MEFELIHPTNNMLVGQYMVGDIFSSNVFLGLRTKYRAWHCQIPSPNMGRRGIGCKICLRYGQPSNSWVLIINGELKAMNVGQMVDEMFTICFRHLDQIFLITVKRRSSVRIRMTMTMNGYEIKEIRKTAEIAVDEAPPARVSIPSTRSCLVNGKPVTVYKVCCETSNRERIAVERRYSDFQYLNTMVVGHTGQHLRTTLPKLPPKVFFPLIDQSSESFVSSRREALQAYLQSLLANSKVALYTEVLCFLGLDPTSGQPLEVLPSIDGAFTEQLFVDSSSGHNKQVLADEDGDRGSQSSFTSVEMDD
jgi:hypothetical protein